MLIIGFRIFKSKYLTPCGETGNPRPNSVFVRVPEPSRRSNGKS